MGHRHSQAHRSRCRAGGVAQGRSDMPGSHHVPHVPEQRALEAVLAAVREGVVVYDREGYVVCMNAAMHCLLQGNAASTSAAEAPSDALASDAPIRNTVESHLLAEVIRQAGRSLGAASDTTRDHTLDTDVRVHLPNGQERWLSVTRSPVRDASAGIVGTVAVVRDAPDRQHVMRAYADAQAETTALRETVRHMEEFLAVAAHDLRSPLAVALGTLQLAQRRFMRQRAQVDARYPELANSSEAIHRGLGEATHAVQQLAQSVALLLDVTRARAGQLELKLQHCDLAELVRKQVQAQRIAAAHRDIHLTVLTEEAVLVHADVVRTGEVVANYVTNAIKYSAAAWPVEVEVSVRDDAARVAVRDRGPGLPPIEQERVWEMFYRAPGVVPLSGTVEGSGLGLGLHICKRIIEQHGGVVGVDSTMGAGSTFWFTLPLAAPAMPEAHGTVAAGEESTA
ncbi:MAG TPA: ATP-binding protein [Ktedonobacterales bacterium]